MVYLKTHVCLIKDKLHILNMNPFLYKICVTWYLIEISVKFYLEIEILEWMSIEIDHNIKLTNDHKMLNHMELIWMPSIVIIINATIILINVYAFRYLITTCGMIQQLVFLNI